MAYLVDRTVNGHIFDSVAKESVVEVILLQQAEKLNVTVLDFNSHHPSGGGGSGSMGSLRLAEEALLSKVRPWTIRHATVMKCHCHSRTVRPARHGNAALL